MDKTASAQKQKGAVLIVTLTLLFALTILSSFSAKVVVTEQKLSTNEIHIAKSSHAADAGIDLFLAGVADETQSAILLADIDMNGQPDGSISGTLGTGDQTYNITLTAPTANDFSLLQVNSVGCSDGYAGTCDTDAPSHKVINQYFSLTNAIASSPDAPLTAREDVDISSAIHVKTLVGNGDLVVLSGGSYNDNGATGITSNGVDVSGLAPAPPFIETNDAILAAMSEDAFFESFFGAPKRIVRAFAEQMNCMGGCDRNDLNAALLNSRVVWANGDLSLMTGTYGTAAEPIILIVDGEFAIRGGAVVNGLVYIASDDGIMNGAGASEVNGAVISEGDFETSGNLQITFDPTILSNLGNHVAGVARVSGSWIDF